MSSTIKLELFKINDPNRKYSLLQMGSKWAPIKEYSVKKKKRSGKNVAILKSISNLPVINEAAPKKNSQYSRLK